MVSPKLPTIIDGQGWSRLGEPCLAWQCSRTHAGETLKPHRSPAPTMSGVEAGFPSATVLAAIAGSSPQD